MLKVVIVSATIFVLIRQTYTKYEAKQGWSWSCEDGSCRKHLASKEEPRLCLAACKMVCGDHGTLWPVPTGRTSLGVVLQDIDPLLIEVRISNSGSAHSFVQKAAKRFKTNVVKLVPGTSNLSDGSMAVDVWINIQDMNKISFSLDMSEGYGLRITAADSRVNVTIAADTFFGARHALETLQQLIIYDDIHRRVKIVRDVNITDKPVYPYRGILLDTSRNYYDVDSIKRTINGMAAVKLNTFHWHITDTQSFPFVSGRRRNLTTMGAYSPDKIYTKADIADIVEFGLVHGVRVLPEFDGPAHVGEGWQGTNLTVCFNAVPWNSFCKEPPCGQLDPSKYELYDVLEDVYRDMFDVFKPDMFHMGGDEVSIGCWNSSADIRTFMKNHSWDLDTDGFHELWNYYQESTKDRVYKANNGNELPIILWTSGLTEHKNVEQYLDKKKYIIQAWTKGSDTHLHNLLEKGYRIILSNYDSLYLDCGFASWTSEGNNWCSPYIGWQKIYDNSPANISGQYKHLILGGEAALWSEQSDSSTMDGRIWPRAAAMAERLWSEPKTGWRKATQRFLHIREQLVKLGINAESIQPEWCYQNEGYCTSGCRTNQTGLVNMVFFILLFIYTHFYFKFYL